MSRKRILILLCAFVVACVMGISALTIFADDNDKASGDGATNVLTESENSAGNQPGENDRKPEKKPGKAREEFFKRFSRDLTDEEKAELKEKFKAKKEEMKNKINAAREKWNSLTDEQKAEIYDLKDKIADLEKQLADKCKNFGIIDDETAEKFKNHIAQRNEQMKKSGRMPMFGKGCRKR